MDTHVLRPVGPHTYVIYCIRPSPGRESVGPRPFISLKSNWADTCNILRIRRVWLLWLVEDNGPKRQTKGYNTLWNNCRQVGLGNSMVDVCFKILKSSVTPVTKKTYYLITILVTKEANLDSL